MAGFGRRLKHRHHRTRTRRLSFAAIAAICVACALVFSIVTGLVLRSLLDEETLLRLSRQSTTQTVEDPIETYLPAISATPIRLREVTDTMPPLAAVSVTLNSSKGTLYYTSPVGTYYGLPSTPNTDLYTVLTALDVASSYISGVFHPQAFLQATTDMHYAVAAEERALLREFVRNGGDEILLVNVPLDADTVTTAAAYAKGIKQDIGSHAVGVAVPLSVATAENGWEILGTLLKSCDFCALDLRAEAAGTEDNAKTLLSTIAYYLEQYDMRVLVSESQTVLIDAIQAAGIADYEILSTPEAEPEEPTPDEPNE